MERISDYIYHGIEENLHSYKQQRFIFFISPNQNLQHNGNLRGTAQAQGNNIWS